MSNEQRKALRHRWMIVTRSSAFVHHSPFVIRASSFLRASSFGFRHSGLRHSFVLRHWDFAILGGLAKMSNEQRKALRRRPVFVTRSSSFVRHSPFVIRASSFFRASSFELRHFLGFVIRISSF